MRLVGIDIVKYGRPLFLASTVSDQGVRVQDYAWRETTSIDGQEANRCAASGSLRGGTKPRLADDDSPKRL